MARQRDDGMAILQNVFQSVNATLPDPGDIPMLKCGEALNAGKIRGALDVALEFYCADRTG